MRKTSDPAFTQNIGEAEIDWIMAVELNSNSSFRNWLGQQLFDFVPRHDGAWKSIVEDSGESDLVWRVMDGEDQFHLALIENKIKAREQPNQCRRYSERGDHYLAEGIGLSYCTALMAPDEYSSGDADDYEFRISYEETRDYFRSEGTERGRYIATLLDVAIAKVPKFDPVIAEFRREVCRIAQDLFSHLDTPQPTLGHDFWVTRSFPNFYLIYKPRLNRPREDVDGPPRAVVDIQLPKRAEDLELLRDRYGQQLATIGASVERAGQSAVFRVVMPTSHWPDPTEQDIKDALGEWSKLWQWSQTVDLSPS